VKFMASTPFDYSRLFAFSIDGVFAKDLGCAVLDVVQQVDKPGQILTVDAWRGFWNRCRCLKHGFCFLSIAQSTLFISICICCIAPPLSFGMRQKGRGAPQAGRRASRLQSSATRA
jgi:hypothetical protein